MIEYRGPQFVQFVNGYRYRRLSGSIISARQSGHAAMSGRTTAVLLPESSLCLISKPEYPTGSRCVLSRLCIKARGGVSSDSRNMNRLSCEGAPSTSIVTPCGELFTQPFSPSSVARRKTKGRKPTPCTAPRTNTRSRPIAEFSVFCRDAGFIFFSRFLRGSLFLKFSELDLKFEPVDPLAQPLARTT